MPEPTRERAEFCVVGRLTANPILKKSKSDNSFCRPDIKVKPSGKGPERRYFMVCFGQVADDLCLDTQEGDTVEVKGDIQFNKNPTTNRWEPSFIMRSFEKVAQAPQNSADEIAKAFDATEVIGF